MRAGSHDDEGSHDNAFAARMLGTHTDGWASLRAGEGLLLSTTARAGTCRRFAVWANWNSNGEFVKYTVPPGKPLKVWRGETASQLLEDARGHAVKDAKGNNLWLEGGAEQMVVHPKDMDKAYMSPREFTGWGYDSFDVEVGLVGVPILQSKWR